MDYQLTSRRQLLTVVGTGTTVALAGCSGNEQDGSQSEDSDGDSTEQDDGSNSGQSESGDEDGSEEPEATGNEPGEYPQQETTGLMAKADQLVDEREDLYAFRIDNYDFLNIEEFPDILDEYEESSLQELAESGGSVPYAQALYLAANMEIPGDMESDDLYFVVPDQEDTNRNMSIYVNLEDQSSNADLTQKEIYIQASLDEAADESAEIRRGNQAEFFRDHVDPDGIVHAIDLAEHDYAVDALHSGF